LTIETDSGDLLSLGILGHMTQDGSENVFFVTSFSYTAPTAFGTKQEVA